MKTKKQKSGIGSVVSAVKSESVPTLVKAGIGTAAVIAGSAGASMIPNVTVLEKVPAVGNVLSKTVPGLGLILIAGIVAYNVKDEKAKTAAIGLGIAGTIDILRRNNVLAMINEKIKTGLNGLRGAADQLRSPIIDTTYKEVSSSQLLQ